MRRSAFFVSLFVVLAGIGGFFLRTSELLNVFDPLTGLPARNAATTLWLIIFSAAVVAVMVAFAISVAVRYKALPGFESAFGTDPLAYPIIFFFIGIAWLAGTYFYFMEVNSQRAITASDIYFIVLSALSAISITLFAIEMYQDSRRKTPYLLSVLPTVFMCFWLIFMYRQNATNPILISYIYQCLAIVATALSFYFTSGFLYGKPAPGKSLAAYYAAIYFCIVPLADGHSLGVTLIFCALIAANLVYSTLLLRNLQRK